MCNTILEDVLVNAKHKIKVRDRIILVLSAVIIFLICTIAYLGYHVFYNNNLHEEFLKNRVIRFELCVNNQNTNNNNMNKRRKRLNKIAA